MHRSVQQQRQKRVLSKRAAAIISIIGVLAVSAVGVAAARYLGRDGGSHANATNLAGKSTSDRNAQSAGSSSRPSPTPDPTHPSTVSRKPHHRPAPRQTPHHASPPASSTPTSATCTHPQFQTSDPSGGWTDGNYYVSNNMWNASGYNVTQTLYACSYANWYVVANMNNDNGDGAVKTYPNAQETFGNNPQISSFHSISSTFAEKSPHVGIYEDAYDVWINGLATSGSTEVMIWTENFHQAPSGSVQATVSFGGRSYKVYKSGSYIAFVADTNFTSGTMNLLKFFKFVINKHWIAGSSELSQIDYGAEIVSTNSRPATFTFTNFSVHTS